MGTGAKSPVTYMGNNEEKNWDRVKKSPHRAEVNISIYIYISFLFLIFKPTKSCQYNFWMKGTGKIRQCWYNTQKKLQYKSGQLVHARTNPSRFNIVQTGETEMYPTQHGEGSKNQKSVRQTSLYCFSFTGKGSRQAPGSCGRPNKQPPCFLVFPADGVAHIYLIIDRATQHSTGHLESDSQHQDRWPTKHIQPKREIFFFFFHF